MFYLASDWSNTCLNFPRLKLAEMSQRYFSISKDPRCFKKRLPDFIMGNWKVALPKSWNNVVEIFAKWGFYIKPVQSLSRAKWPIKSEPIPLFLPGLSKYEYFYSYFSFTPGWDSSPSQGYPQRRNRQNQFLPLGGDRHSENKVFCSGTQTARS